MSFYKLTPLAARMLTTLMTSTFVYEESFGINEERHWRSAIAPAAIGP